MIVEDLWTAKGPTATELKVLERLGRRRRALEATPPGGEEEAYLVARALTLLDDMEECLCEEGSRAPDLDRGWHELEQLEECLEELLAKPAPSRPVPVPSARGPVARVEPITRRLSPATPTTEGAERPLTQGDPNVLTTAIETIRSVAHRAVDDPQPPAIGAASGPPAAANFGARLWRLLIRLLDADMPEGRLLRIIVQALRALLPLLGVDLPPADPPTDPPADPAANPPADLSQPVKTRARIDLLRQERAARSQERSAAAARANAAPDRPPVHRARPDVPPASPPDAEVWHCLLDLSSEAVETYVATADAEGIGRCVELLDTLAETFAGELSEAA